MALVPYASSDVSDSEDENENSNDSTSNESTSVFNNQPNTISNKNACIELSDVLNNHRNHDEEGVIETRSFNNELFKALPTPKQTDSAPISEEFDEFLHKREVPVAKPTVKISVPTFKDESEEPQIKKFKSSTKTTGLFSVLPPPRSAAIVPQKLIPKSVTQQIRKSIPDKVLKPPSVNKTVKSELPKVPVFTDKETIEDDVVEGNDFFSLTADTEESPQSVLDVVADAKTDITPTPLIEELVVVATANDFIPLSTEISERTDNIGLDEEALRALCGARGAKQRRETQILDLHESEVRPASSEWMQQALLKGTDNEPPAPTTALPGGMQRRKHQITYLAQQAKANEQQLKNMWAQNRFTRQQTQSKYGF